MKENPRISAEQVPSEMQQPIPEELKSKKKAPTPPPKKKKKKARPPKEDIPIPPDEVPSRMQKPVPEDLICYVPIIETYVVEQWLPSLSNGANFRKLQRDIAFRMENGPPGKLDRSDLDTIVGELHRKGVIGLRHKDGDARSFNIIPPPPVPQEQEEGGNRADDGAIDDTVDNDDFDDLASVESTDDGDHDGRKN